jgi:hypothetical protein
MTNTTVTVTPRCETDFIELSNTGNLFLKKVLPKGSINYQGQKVTFNDKFLGNIVESFKKGAYDQTSFVFANEKNQHNLDPKKWGGEVKGLEVRNDGLYATLELSSDAAELVRKNKKLGVSCSIKANYTRETDGQSFPAALNHVLGTLDPKVTGLGEWQELKLSNENETQTDLSNLQWLSDTPPVQSGQPTKQQVDDAALAIQLAQQVQDSEGGKGVKDNPAPSIDLANNAEYQAGLERIKQLEIDLANERFEKESAALIEAGVPPVLLNLAAPILKSVTPLTINLSNGEDDVNVAGVVRDMLTQCKGMIKLSNEQGNSFSDTSTEEGYVDKALKDWEV